LRELRLLLDLFRNKSVLIKMDSCHHSFFLSSLVEGENKVGIIDDESGVSLISDKWSEVADFIRAKGKMKKIICGDECLYTMLLTLVAVAFVYPDPDMQEPDKAKYIQFNNLAEKEPELRRVQNHLN
jgi:hypothetical protein